MLDAHRADVPSRGRPEAHESAARDLAFADTVLALDLDAIPPSTANLPAVPASSRRASRTALVPPPFARPSAPPPPARSGRRLRPQGPIARLRLRMTRSREEIRALWSATASLEETHDSTGAVVYEEDPFVRAATVGRRVRTLFSFFEWDRADVLRAAWIGLAVFVVVATVGAVVLERKASQRLNEHLVDDAQIPSSMPR